MRKNLLLFSLFASLLMFYGCIEIDKKKFTPQYACLGDDIKIQIELSRKATFITLTDATGKELSMKKRTRKFNYKVKDIRPDQLPLTISLFKERDLWWDWDKVITPAIEIFPTSQWSTGIETMTLNVKKETQVKSYEKTGEACECINYDEKENKCLEEKCEPYVDCLSDYTFIYTPETIKWKLPNWNYSPNIKVAGVKNTSPYPISVHIKSRKVELAPGAEYLFEHASISSLEIEANIPPELQISQECGTITKCCEGEECHNYTQLKKSDYPDPLGCFEDLKTSVQLLMVCSSS